MGLGDGVAPVGVVFLAALVVTGWSVLSLVLTPLFLASLVLVPEVSRVVKPAYRRATHFIQWAWMANVAFMLEFLFGMHVTVTGDAATKAKEAELLSGERALWVPNHRTRIDWMLLWTMAVRTGTLGQMKIVLKAPLRTTPIFGWATQHFLFIFLNRHWEDDERMLNTLLPFLVANEPQASYMLFPEGTDLADTNLEKSAAFAKKNNLPERKFSLYPRTTGFKFMFPRIRDQLDAVYDITMFFVDHAPNERPSEAALLSGRTPRSIHFHLERIAISDMPKKENDLGAWVEKSFERKEKNLKAYYEKNGRLPDGAVPLTFGDPMASYSLVVVFWIWFLTLATKMAWFWGWWSIYFGGVVAVGYAILTFAFGGVDGVLRKIL